MINKHDEEQILNFLKRTNKPSKTMAFQIE